MPNERGNIFQEEICRSLVFDNSGKFKKQSSAGIVKAPSEPATRKPITDWWLVGTSELCRLFAFVGGILATFWANCDNIVLSEKQKV